MYVINIEGHVVNFYHLMKSHALLMHIYGMKNVVGRLSYPMRARKFGVGIVFMAGYPAGYLNQNQNLFNSSSCYTNYSCKVSCITFHLFGCNFDSRRTYTQINTYINSDDYNNLYEIALGND